MSIIYGFPGKENEKEMSKPTLFSVLHRRRKIFFSTGAILNENIRYV